MPEVKVFLIGGAPGAGKTSLGRALAKRLGITSLTIDDLLVAAKAVATPESNPGLFIMSQRPYLEYFTYSSVDKLTSDALVQHDAIWPSVENVIRSHATWGSRIVIDGWALQPKKIVKLNLDNVKSFWLVTDRSVLEERERKNTDFFGKSPDPERMLNNFLARSFWYNDLIADQASKFDLPIFHQDGTVSVEDLCDKILNSIR